MVRTLEAIDEYHSIHAIETVTIADGETESDVIDIYGYTIVGFKFGTLSGTLLTFEADILEDGSSGVQMYDADGNAIEVTITEDAWVAVDPVLFSSVRFIKCITDVAPSGSDNTFELILRRVQ